MNREKLSKKFRTTSKRPICKTCSSLRSINLNCRDHGYLWYWRKHVEPRSLPDRPDVWNPDTVLSRMLFSLFTTLWYTIYGSRVGFYMIIFFQMVLFCNILEANARVSIKKVFVFNREGQSQLQLFNYIAFGLVLFRWIMKPLCTSTTSRPLLMAFAMFSTKFY